MPKRTHGTTSTPEQTATPHAVDVLLLTHLGRMPDRPEVDRAAFSTRHVDDVNVELVCAFL